MCSTSVIHIRLFMPNLWYMSMGHLYSQTLSTPVCSCIVSLVCVHIVPYVDGQCVKIKCYFISSFFISCVYRLILFNMRLSRGGIYRYACCNTYKVMRSPAFVCLWTKCIDYLIKCNSFPVYYGQYRLSVIKPTTSVYMYVLSV